MLWGGGMSRTGVATVGGIAGAALITSLASQGLQYLGSYLFARGIGDHNRNVLVGLCVNTVLTALGTAGLPYAREAFLLLGFGLGGFLLLVGILSDLRSIFAPKGGIGLYFGTFNPVHNTHLAILKRAMAERKLDKIIIHPTLIPRFTPKPSARARSASAGCKTASRSTRRPARPTSTSTISQPATFSCRPRRAGR